MKSYWIHITCLAKLVSKCTGEEDTVQEQQETARPRTHLEQHSPVLLRIRGLDVTGSTGVSPAGLCFQGCVVNPSLHHCGDAAAAGAELLLLIKARVLQNPLWKEATTAGQVGQVGLAANCKHCSAPWGAVGAVQLLKRAVQRGSWHVFLTQGQVQT